MGRILLALAIFAVACLAGEAWAHNCTCKYKGGDARQGETRCLMTAEGKRKLARCEMVLNNSSWTVLDEPCGQVSEKTS